MDAEPRANVILCDQLLKAFLQDHKKDQHTHHEQFLLYAEPNQHSVARKRKIIFDH